MSAQSTEIQREDAAFGVASVIAGVGILLFALFPITLPIVILTTIALVPLLAIGIVPALLIGLVAVPVLLVRRLRHHDHDRPEPEPSRRSPAPRPRHVPRMP